MKRVIPKVVTMVCIVSMILGLYQPVSVKAYVYQDNELSKIYVGGSYIINKGKFVQTTVSGDKGIATYDVVNNVLTLDNFESNEAININYMDGIQILVKGTVKINKTSGTAFMIYQDGPATIIGQDNGNLIIKSGNEYDEGGAGISGGRSKFNL